MSNIFDDVRAAVQNAKVAQRAVNENGRAMAELIAGNLRKADIPQSVLARLKRELRDYNIHTGRWSE